MSRKTKEQSLTTPAPIPLGDDALSAVTGGKGQGHAYGLQKSKGPPWLAALGGTTIVQNIDIDITQVAGDGSTQVAGVVAGNASTVG